MLNIKATYVNSNSPQNIKKKKKNTLLLLQTHEFLPYIKHKIKYPECPHKSFLFKESTWCPGTVKLQK